MIIQLKQLDGYGWRNTEHNITLCGNIMSQLGLIAGNKYNMTLRTKNPRRRGYIKVHLTKSSFWKWSIPSMVLKNMGFASEYFSGGEMFLNSLFPRHIGHTDQVSYVWVKFEKA